MLEFTTTLAAPLARLWEFHQDVKGSLPALSPPGKPVKIESADLPPVVGARIVILAKGPLGMRIRWVARIVEYAPPHAVGFGEEARFVDEQESGPFAYWRHEHEFERVDDKTTRLLDRVTYRVPLGPIGWLADWVFVRWSIISMFKHRHAITQKMLSTDA